MQLDTRSMVLYIRSSFTTLNPHSQALWEPGHSSKAVCRQHDADHQVQTSPQDRLGSYCGGDPVVLAFYNKLFDPKSKQLACAIAPVIIGVFRIVALLQNKYFGYGYGYDFGLRPLGHSTQPFKTPKYKAQTTVGSAQRQRRSGKFSENIPVQRFKKNRIYYRC